MKSNINQAIFTTILAVILISCTSESTQIATVEFTKTVEPTLTPTIIPTETITPTNTPEISTDVLDKSTSPDGTWTATITRTKQDKNYHLLFTVSSSSKNQTWVVEDLKFYEPANPLNGYKYPYIFKWSDDGDSLFYSHLSTGGDGCYILSAPGGFDLRKVDLSNGMIVIIQDGGGTWMALSPDESKLAYISGWDGNVTVLDIKTKTEQTFLLPSIPKEDGFEKTTEYAIWSPDGRNIIYAYLWGSCGEYLYSYIILVHLQNQQQTILLNRDEHGFIPIKWNIQDKILLKDNENNNWWLNPFTKEIIPAQ